MIINTLLRDAEHEALRRVELYGAVLDIGGDKRSGYQSVFSGEYTLTTVNADQNAEPDIVHDLETPLPIADDSFDNVLLINILEHIFNYRELLTESARVLKSGGQLVVVVPFLFPVHPSPSDYRRFTAETLRRECEYLGFKSITIVPLGTGVFSATYVMLDRLMPWPVRFASYYSTRYLALALDAVATTLSRLLHKKYDPSHYALGYCVTAKKTFNPH